MNNEKKDVTVTPNMVEDQAKQQAEAYEKMMDEVITMPDGQKLTRRTARENSITQIADVFRKGRKAAMGHSADWIREAATEVTDQVVGLMTWMEQMVSLQKASTIKVSEMIKEVQPVMNGAYENAATIAEQKGSPEIAAEIRLLIQKKEVTNNEKSESKK